MENINQDEPNRNYSYSDIQAGINKLDPKAQELIYSNFKIGEIAYCVSDTGYEDLKGQIIKMIDQYTTLFSGIKELKRILNDGEIALTDDELKDIVVKFYGVLPEDKQSDIRNELELVKDEPITIGKILCAYDGMGEDDKVCLSREIEKRDSLWISLRKLSDRWNNILGAKDE